ncbi:MAG: hypothetical protein ACLSDQ_02285 [Adlercreutzia equolifaciens]
MQVGEVGGAMSIIGPWAFTLLASGQHDAAGDRGAVHDGSASPGSTSSRAGWC